MNIVPLERMLEQGRDNPLLRFALGRHYLETGHAALAVEHLTQCVRQDHGYSAGWKQLGAAQLAAGDAEAARASWRIGIEAAQRRGDRQAAREMEVFLRRLDKSRPAVTEAGEPVGALRAG